MSGRKSQRKGRAFELDIAETFRDAGHPQAKALGIYEAGDVSLPLNGQDLIVECKREKRGRGGFYPLLEASHMVVHKGDHKPVLITMTLDLFLSLGAE